jgi:hypothetical protein
LYFIWDRMSTEFFILSFSCLSRKTNFFLELTYMSNCTCFMTKLMSRICIDLFERPKIVGN